MVYGEVWVCQVRSYAPPVALVASAAFPARSRHARECGVSINGLRVEWEVLCGGCEEMKGLHYKIRLKDAIGLDGKARPYALFIGFNKETDPLIRKIGYSMDWYDGPIHNFYFWNCFIYWHWGVI